ncbi:hypothetical protein DPMN_073541 [Dreissena polymorpha]|uniref:Stalled ribosome sensor GCN1-like HEAT repeats region domain-containing protein n=1 Tax=Dreissena polymorpha TaxID=45954 RepID=A0A9D4BZ95_DREPO|nr:hypothetical protein DPMN_073541 [Dreissena polymorpha]
MKELLAATKSRDSNCCRASVTVLHAFCVNTRASYEEFLPELFSSLIELFAREDKAVLMAAWECLDVITKKLSRDDMLQNIHNVRQAIKNAGAELPGQELPGFISDKGTMSLFTIIRTGILYGSPEIKELSSLTLGELINKASDDALKPLVVKMAGSLIRIVMDRYAPNVKTAVIETLTLLLSKVGVMLKPFLSQLQTTLLKNLNDPNCSVRLKAAAALGTLIGIHTRVDPLFEELHKRIKGAQEISVMNTTLQALRFCLVGAGVNMSAANKKLVLPTLVELLDSQEETTRTVASGCVGSFCKTLSDEELTALLVNELLDTGSYACGTLRHGRGTALGVALLLASDRLWSDQYKTNVHSTIKALTESDLIPLCASGYRCLGYILAHQVQTGDLDSELLAVFLKGIEHESDDIKQLIGQLVIYIISRTTAPLTMEIVKIMIPALVMGAKEKTKPVRTNSELALISLLQLRKGNSYFRSVVNNIDSSSQDSLLKVYSKTLKKMATLPEPLAGNVDDTIIM